MVNDIQSGASACNVRVDTYDATDLRAAGIPPSPPPRHGANAPIDTAWTDRFRSITDSRGHVEPRETWTTSNHTCVGYHEFLTDAAFPGTPPPDYPGLKIGYGSGTVATSPQDVELTTPLNNGEFTISQYGGASGTRTLRTQSTIYESELVDQTIAELGLIGPDGRLWNHSLLPEPITNKGSSTIVNVSVTLHNQDASEVV